MRERDSLAKQLADAITITIQISPPGTRSEMGVSLGASGDDFDGIGTYTKTEADYRQTDDKDRECGKCIHFLSGNSCEIVSGVISKTATCNYWGDDNAD